MFRGRVLRLVLLCGGVLTTAAAQSAGPNIGSTVAAVPAAFNQSDGRTVDLAVGLPIHQDDEVRTGRNGRAAFELIDRTRLELAGDSSLKLDKAVFNPDRSAAEAVIRLSNGLFRFVSGSLSKSETYTINTPHGTLGIRGTILVILVTSNYTLAQARNGRAILCVGGVCETIDALSDGYTAQAGSDGKVEVLRSYPFLEFPAIQQRASLDNNLGLGGSGGPLLFPNLNTSNSGGISPFLRGGGTPQLGFVLTVPGTAGVSLDVSSTGSTGSTGSERQLNAVPTFPIGSGAGGSVSPFR
jgi:FecR protein